MRLRKNDLVPAESESDAISEVIFRVDVLHDVAAVLVEELEFPEWQDDALTAEELKLTLLAGLASDRGVLVKSVFAGSLLRIVYTHSIGVDVVISWDGVGLQERWRERLPETLGAEFGDLGVAPDSVGISLDDSLARGVHGAELVPPIAAADCASERHVRLRVNRVELDRSIAELEPASWVARELG